MRLHGGKQLPGDASRFEGLIVRSGWSKKRRSLEWLSLPMNFLAHLYLSDGTPDSMAGNLMADFLRGRVDPGLPLGIRQGIWLHRQVDAYTDSHAAVRRSVHRLKPRWGRYGLVLVDVLYDYFLASDWDRYSDEPLRAFADRAYDRLAARAHLMPEIMQRAMARMKTDDWLPAYATDEGIRCALERLNRRFRRPPPRPLDRAVEDLAASREELREDFHLFFPELVEFTRSARIPDNPYSD